MKILIASALLLSGVVSAQTTLGPDAVEMFKLLTHPQVVDCLEREKPRMVNIEIKKRVARCPGCHTYTISGNELRIDVPTKEKTVINLIGKSVRSNFGFAQTYSCSVKTATR